MTGLLLASQARRLNHRRRRFVRGSVTLPVASATHQNKTRPKTYPRSLGRNYYGRIRFTEGALMRRRDGGIGCGARGRGMNAPPKLPGGAGVPPGALRPPARNSLTAG